MSPVLNINRTSLYSLVLLLTGNLVFTTAGARDDCYRDLNDRIPCDEYEEEWQESKVTIPAVAKDSDFRLLAVSEADARYRYYLAGSSITQGTDGVTRYTVAVVSGNGARNVFYEGMRCATNEIKTYAYGSKSGRFRRAANSRWRTVSNKGVRAYQDFLAKVIICDANGYEWDAQKARRALQRQFTAGGFRKGVYCRTCDADDFVRND